MSEPKKPCPEMMLELIQHIAEFPAGGRMIDPRHVKDCAEYLKRSERQDDYPRHAKFLRDQRDLMVYGAGAADGVISIISTALDMSGLPEEAKEEGDARRAELTRRYGLV